MIAREDSFPPDVSAASTPAPPTFDTPPPPSKKRKHAAISGVESGAASPAPSDPGLLGAQAAGASVLAADAPILDTRPRHTVSRPPVFLPVSEGSIYNTTAEIPINSRGFRYIPAGLTEPGSLIPCRTIESGPPGYVRISWEDRSPFLKVTTDGLGVCGEKGYRSARLNVPVREGKWYMEIKVELGGGDNPPDSTAKDGAHVRLGWGRREAVLNCPVGIDGYSYGFLDKDGHKITLSRPRPYGQKFGSGDVIGMYISLPPKRKPKANDPHDPAHLKRERIPIDLRGQEYFESIEYTQSKEMIALMDSSSNKAKDSASVPPSTKKSATVKNVPERGRAKKPRPEPAPFQPLPILRGSHIAFFVNGQPQGIAFQDLYDYLQLRTIPSARNQKSRRRQREGYVAHTENPFDDGWLGYYPFISLFNGARVRVNAGPDFEFPPPADIDGVLAGDPDSVDTKTCTWRPLSERYPEFMAEQRELDDKEERDAQEKAQAPLKKEKVIAERPRQNRPPAQHPKPSKSQPQPKPPPEKKFSPKPVPVPPPVPTASTSSHVPKEDPQPPPAVKSDPQPQVSASLPPTEMTEEEKKLAARRERKRELERARRARQREEKLRVKKLEEEQKQAAATADPSPVIDQNLYPEYPAKDFDMEGGPQP